MAVMEIEVRYLTREIAESFGAINKKETIHVPANTNYEGLLSIFQEKLRNTNQANEGLMDSLVFICGGRSLISARKEHLVPHCTVLVGYADTGG
jgi:hypothetical protein